MAEPEKKKSGLGALVLSLGKPKDADDEEDSSEDYSAAAGECFDALKAGDKEAFSEALKAVVMSCKH